MSFMVKKIPENVLNKYSEILDKFKELIGKDVEVIHKNECITAKIKLYNNIVESN